MIRTIVITGLLLTQSIFAAESRGGQAYLKKLLSSLSCEVSIQSEDKRGLLQRIKTLAEKFETVPPSIVELYVSHAAFYSEIISLARSFKGSSSEHINLNLTLLEEEVAQMMDQMPRTPPTTPSFSGEGKAAMEGRYFHRDGDEDWSNLGPDQSSKASPATGSATPKNSEGDRSGRSTGDESRPSRWPPSMKP